MVEPKGVMPELWSGKENASRAVCLDLTAPLPKPTHS